MLVRKEGTNESKNKKNYETEFHPLKRKREKNLSIKIQI